MKTNHYLFIYEDGYEAYWETESTPGEIFHAVHAANKSLPKNEHGRIKTVRKISQEEFYKRGLEL